MLVEWSRADLVESTLPTLPTSGAILHDCACCVLLHGKLSRPALRGRVSFGEMGKVGALAGGRITALKALCSE